MTRGFSLWTAALLARGTAWFLRASRHPARFLLLFVIPPLALVIIVTHQVNVNVGRRQALRNLRTTAQIAAQAIDEALTHTQHFEQMLAAQPAFVRAVQQRDAESLAQFLQEPLQFIPGADLALALTPEGRILAAFPPTPDAVGWHLANDEGLPGARAGGWRPYVSAVHVRDNALLDKVVDVVVPVSDGRAVIGALEVEYQVEAVRSWVQKVRVEPEGFLYVVDHRQQLVVYPFQVLPGTPRVVADWPPVAQPLPPEGGTLTFREERTGARWLAGMSPIGETGWRVVAVQPERAVFRLLHQVLWPMGLLAGFLLVLVVALSLGWIELEAFKLQAMASEDPAARDEASSQRPKPDPQRAQERLRKETS